jgi:hypothetical protein
MYANVQTIKTWGAAYIPFGFMVHVLGQDPNAREVCLLLVPAIDADL